mgnify:CR=1 FL=1
MKTTDQNLWHPPLLGDWCAAVDLEPEPLFILEDFIPTDAAVLMSGTAKVSYKTWLAFLMCQAVASGKTLYGIEPKVSGPVLIIEQEGPRKQTRNRWKFLENGQGGVSITGLPIYFAHREGLQLDKPEHLQKLVNFVKQEGVVLTVIDTLAKSHNGDENSTRDVSNAMTHIDTIRKANRGSSVLFLHHLRKETMDPNTDIDADVRGSSALVGFYDTHIALRKKKKNQSYIELTVRASDEEEKQYHVSWYITKQLARAEVTIERVDPNSIADSVKIEAATKLLPGQTYTYRQLEDMWGFDRDRTKLLADILKEDGVLLQAGRTFCLA